MIEAKREVSQFLAKDESSRLTAGKKETITRKKIKKQKRLLNDTLKNLFKKFIMEYPMYKNMSYSLFSSFVPSGLFHLMLPIGTHVYVKFMRILNC